MAFEPTPAGTAVAEGLSLTRIILTWFFSPQGFTKYTKEEKLEKFNDLIKKFLDEKDLASASVIINELYQLSIQEPRG